MFISKLVKCRQQRENKEETIRDKRREEKREQKSREEKKRKDKKKCKKSEEKWREEKRREERRREKNRREEKEEKKNCVKERACILQTFYHKNMLKNMAYVLDNKLSKYNSTLLHSCT